jgi:hypothetical protein
MQRDWLRSAARRYDDCNQSTLAFILSRPPLPGGLVDTKVHSITGENYNSASGVRGPNFTYGWIQGRALEALIAFARFYEGRDPDLSRRLMERARWLFDALNGLYQRDGHIYFLYNRNLEPIRAADDGHIRQQTEPDIFTYSDAFAAKGLFAASRAFATENASTYLDYLLSVIDAVEDERFQMNETVRIGRTSIADEADDFGPRMILLGAAGLMHDHGEARHTDFADRFIDHVIAKHHHKETGLLLNVPGDDTCNVGHAIEFCGFGFEHLQARPDPVKLKELGSVLTRSLQVGMQGPGIALYLSAKTGQPVSSYYPWWPMPEAVRACSLAMYLDDTLELQGLWQQCDGKFFTNYWQADQGFAFQTRDVAGPVDFVPATPDLDPGYHTGLSLLRARRTIDLLLTQY